MTCQHPPCTCQVADGLDYCAPTCRTGIGDTGEACKCGHSDCEESEGNASI